MISLHSTLAEAALRDLCAEPAAVFGRRLLARANGRFITFHEFVAVARDLIRTDPDAMATWLAALVALEVRGEAKAPDGDGPPSAN